jgi:hypothetical protein
VSSCTAALGSSSGDGPLGAVDDLRLSDFARPGPARPGLTCGKPLTAKRHGTSSQNDGGAVNHYSELSCATRHHYVFAFANGSGKLRSSLTHLSALARPITDTVPSTGGTCTASMSTAPCDASAHLQSVIADADYIRLWESTRTNEGRSKLVIAEETDPMAIKELVGHLHIDNSKGGTSSSMLQCMCVSPHFMDMCRGDTLIASLSIIDGSVLRWRDVWKGDAPLRHECQSFVCEWLAARGMRRPLEQLQASAQVSAYVPEVLKAATMRLKDGRVRANSDADSWS